MQTVKVRASDIARAFAYNQPIDFNRPYQNGNTVADKLHEDYAHKNGTVKPEDLDSSLKYLSRMTGNILVMGRADGLRVSGDEVTIVEFKTIWGIQPRPEVIAQATLQVQIYAWLIQPQLNRLNKRLAPIHYVEIIDRRTGQLVMSVKVARLDSETIERIIWYTVYRYVDNKEGENNG
jgi:ATP-dependent exoDNAse (exonuclease V) beta subunit